MIINNKEKIVLEGTQSELLIDLIYIIGALELEGLDVKALIEKYFNGEFDYIKEEIKEGEKI